MEFPSLTAEERHHEFHFGPDEVRTFATLAAESDVRSLKEKLLFRTVASRKPAWSATADRFEFTSGAGATGTGNLWTRPVALPVDLPVRGAFFNLLERREVAEEAEGEQTLTAHVRSEPQVGEGSDLANRVVPLHAQSDASDPSWRGHFVDLTPLVAGARSTPVYLTFELANTCTRAPRSASALAFAYRALALSLVIGSPGEASAPTQTTMASAVKAP